jgi:hypothetical protein
MRRSESERLPKSGRLVRGSSDLADLTDGFQVGLPESVLDPGGK